MDYSKFKNKKFIISTMAAIIIAAIAIYFSFDMFKSSYKNYPILKENMQILGEKQAKQDDLKTDVAKQEQISKDITEQEKREDMLLESIKKEFPQLENLNTLQNKIVNMQKDLENIINITNSDLYIKYDTELAKKIDKSYLDDAVSTFVSSIFPGLGTSTEMVADEKTKNEVCKPINVLRDYSFYIQDCLNNLDNSSVPIYSKLQAISQSISELQNSDIFIPEYQEIQKNIDSLETSEFKTHIQNIYNNLYLLKNSLEQVYDTSSILIEDETTLDVYKTSISEKLRDIEAEMNNLSTKYSVLVSDDVKNKAIEKRTEQMNEFIDMIKFMDSNGYFHSANSYFLQTGSEMEAYKSGEGSSMYRALFKHEQISVIRHVSNTGGSANEYYIYDRSKKPMAIVAKEPQTAIYLYNGEVWYSTVENPDIYISYAQNLINTFDNYNSSEYQEQRDIKKDFKKYYQNENPF